MASDELKRYAPTPRRLAKLRRAGDVAASAALTAVAGLAAATGAALALGPGLAHRLAGVLAQDLQVAGTMTTSPPALLAHMTHRLGLAVVVMAAIAGGLGLVQTVVHLLQTGFATRGTDSASPALPWGAGRGGRISPPAAETVLGLGLGLLVAAGCGAGLLGNLAAARSWADLGPGPAWGSLGGRWLVGLAGLALLHLALTRGRFQQRAAMSHRDLQDEARETAGPGLTRRGGQGKRPRG
jgi:flagellar biosynthesis protein FlhB